MQNDIHDQVIEAAGNTTATSTSPAQIEATDYAADHPILQSENHAETDFLTHSRVREGNKVVHLPSGITSYAKRWELLEKAQHSIHIVAFSLMRDKTSFRLRDLLLKKLSEGVKVRLIFDDGVMLSTFSGGIVKTLEKAGAGTVRYHKFFRGWFPKWREGHPFRQIARTAKFKLKRHFHEKYLIVDGREAILGGLNWGDKYALGGIKPKAWRDSDAYISGPVVADIQKQFVKDFFRYKAMNEETDDGPQREAAFMREEGSEYFPYLPKTGDEEIRYVAHKPYDDNELTMTDAFLQLIREAKRYIYWGCHGIRPPRILAEALAEAAARGVEIRLITNSKRASKTLMLGGLLGWMYWESSNHFRWLIERGIRVFEWQKPGAFHAKNIVIDGVFASVGSYNIARGSALHHSESNIFVYGGDFPANVRDQFELDLRDCKEVTLETAKKVRKRFDPFRRILHERNLLLKDYLLTPAVRADLHAGKFKTM